jgi:hypothetical protein
MPDERTVLLVDGATHGGLFMFIADRLHDLSAGTLYVGTRTQISGTGPGGESTGLQAVDDVNGFSHIMSNFQHPGDWEGPLYDVVKPALGPLVRANYNDRFSAAACEALRKEGLAQIGHRPAGSSRQYTSG